MASLADTSESLRLLADTNRLRLLALLQAEELTVAELVRVTGMTQSRVSTHLGRLREAGLVHDRRAGNATFYRAREGKTAGPARALWEQVRVAADDPLLETDAARVRVVLSERSGRAEWADGVAGSMERRYSPGRTWESALRSLLGLLRLGAVLDIASGDCAIAELLAPRAATVTCLDHSPAVLEVGRHRLRAFAHARFVLGDMQAIPLPSASFDQVLLLASLMLARDPARAVREAARVLRPGGVLVANALASHRHAERAAEWGHVHPGFTPRALRAMAEDAGLAVELCEVTSRERRVPHFEVVTLHARRDA